MKKIIVFLLACFAIPVPCVLISRGSSNDSVSFILFGIRAAAPSIAALLTVSILEGSRGLKEFFARCYACPKNPAKTLGPTFAALALPLLFGLCAKLAYSVGAPASDGIVAHVSARRLIIVCWALVAEEMGWRGFLQPELTGAGKRKILAPLAVGGIWALWHYHFYWTGSIDVPAGIFLAGCVAESYVYYVLTARSGGGIVTASVWHFAGNLALALFAVNPDANGGSVVPYAVYTALMCALGGVCLLREFAPRGKTRGQESG